MEFKFEKNGISFIFKKPILNEYGKLEFNWRAEGTSKSKNKYDTEGLYGGAVFDTKIKGIRCNFKFNGKECGGVVLPEDIYEQILTIYNKYTEERKNKINELVEQIILGKKPINVSIVGCDYPHYQAWVRDIDKDLKGLEQDIMYKAIKQLVPNSYVGNSCDFIGKYLGTKIQLKEEITSKAFNLNIVDNVVTSFDIKLTDAIEKAIQEEKKEIEEKLAKEKQKELDFQEVKKFEEEKKYDSSEKANYYIYTVAFKNGKEYSFVDRNLFDVGRVINPNYEVAKGLGGGLIHKDKETNKYYWQTFNNKEGWIIVRELEEEELKAYNLVEKYGNGLREVRM